jgi:hypothetical protein
MAIYDGFVNAVKNKMSTMDKNKKIDMMDPVPTEVDHESGYEEGENELVKKIMHMFEISKNAKKEMADVWRESESLYAGEHWKDFKMPKFKNELTLDLIGSAVDTMIPILSSQPPKIDIIAYGQDEEDKDIADMMQGVLDEVWSLRDMPTLIPEWLTDFLVYGTGILKVHFRNEDDLPDCDVVDPFTFFVNPSATKLENTEYVIYAAPTPLHEIRDRYPEKGSQVVHEGRLGDYEALKINEGKDGQTNRSRVQISTQGTAGSTKWDYENNRDAMKDLEPRALLIECIMRDGSKIVVDGKETHKYPGKMRMVTICNGKILYDGPSKYNFFNRTNGLPYPFPYVVLKNSGSAHSFWGKPEPKRLKSINLAMDRLSSQVLDNISLTANPMWVVDETAQVTDQISNKPGSVIRKKGPGTVDMKTPASVPGYVFNFYQQLMDSFEVVSGVNRATQGKADTNVTSGVQAQIYRQAATTKIDFKARIVDHGIQTLGQMWLSMFLNLGTEVHFVSVKDPDGVEQMQRIIGALFKEKRFAVRARKGSMLPENRTFVENKMLQLAQMGILTDQEYLLENMELPGKERLLRKLQEQKEAAAQAEAEQQSVTGQMGEDPSVIFDQLANNPELMEQAAMEMGEPKA